MASSIIQLPTTPYGSAIDDTESEFRIVQSNCIEFHNGVVPSNIFATQTLPRMLESLQSLLYRYGREITYQDHHVSDIERYIATKNDGDKQFYHTDTIGALQYDIVTRIGSLDFALDYLKRMVDCIEDAMVALDDTLIGLGVEMDWEVIKWDVRESKVKTVTRLADLFYQSADSG